MPQKDKLRIALVQCDIKDLQPEENFKQVEAYLAELAGRAELAVFPETITTGFSKEAGDYATPWGGEGLCSKLTALSIKYGIALAGSALVTDEGQCYNRFFLIDGERVQWQDKRHLFSLGGEAELVAPTTERRVLEFRSWRIMPLVCYDLRFPVWCRCRDNDYDLIICVANWPRARRSVWTTLLQARAMENLAYAIGVNRIGRDAVGLEYTGDSLAYNPRGEVLYTAPVSEPMSHIVELEPAPLEDLRRKFPVWQDADDFSLHL